MRTITWMMAIVLLVSLGLGGAAGAVYDPMSELEKTLQGGASSVQGKIRRLLDTQVQGALLESQGWGAMRKYYEDLGYRPLWLVGTRPKPVVEALFQRIRTTPGTGLKESDLISFEGFMPSAPAIDRAAGYELRFSEIVLRYARILATGRFLPKKTDPDWYIKPREFDIGNFLTKLAEAKVSLSALLDTLEPQHGNYLRLRKAYEHYLAIAERGGWSALPAGMTTLKPGMSSKWVPDLRRRLQAEFEFNSAEPEESKLYDMELVEAVKTFQRRNGLEVDAVVGSRTRELLSQPVDERLRSILATIERWRWMPRDLGDRYLLVNIPSFELFLFEGGQEIWQSKVIAGRTERPTPSISSTISVLKVNPKWHVPEKIAVKDLVPKQLRNPNFLHKSGYKVYLAGTDEEIDPRDIDWEYYKDAEDFPYRLKQRSGDLNALGRLKFEMPSRHAIYLHDTPTKDLFEREERMFSSGCVRVQSPYELAGILLNKAEPDQGRFEVLKEIETGETKHIQLPEKVPVYLTYFTAWVDEKGEVNFRRDVYDRNKLFADIPVINH